MSIKAECGRLENPTVTVLVHHRPKVRRCERGRDDITYALLIIGHQQHRHVFPQECAEKDRGSHRRTNITALTAPRDRKSRSRRESGRRSVNRSPTTESVQPMLTTARRQLSATCTLDICPFTPLTAARLFWVLDIDSGVCLVTNPSINRETSKGKPPPFGSRSYLH